MAKKKKYYPIQARQNRQPEQRKPRNNNQIIIKPQTPNLFRGNLANNMNFGRKGQTISGYTRRELIYQDANGNCQIARETQFYNAGHRIRVRINSEKSESKH